MPQLAAFYIGAQIIERVTELFSRIGDKPRGRKTEEDRKVRAVWLWIVSSVLGVILAWVMKLGFFSVSGLEYIDPRLDYVLSGMALGGRNEAGA